jgi:hypothetical protein
LCEPEKSNNNKWRANHPNEDIHDSTHAAQSTTAILVEATRAAIEKPAGQSGGLVGADLN